MVLTSDKDPAAESSKCELIGKRDCNHVAQGKLFLPEWFVREAISSFLVPCLYRHCVAFDIGANLGFVTAYMASLGAHVTAIEPQPPMVSALRRTLENNCWQERVKVHNAFVSVHQRDIGKSRTENSSNLWSVDRDRHEMSSFERPYLYLPEVFINARHADFIKLDIDSIEATVVHSLYKLVVSKKFTFNTLIFEVNLASEKGRGFVQVAEAFCGFQNDLGYDIYKLNQHEHRHWFDSKGVDGYSTKSAKAYSDSPFVEERFSQRFMRFLLWFKPQPEVKQWRENLLFGLEQRSKQIGVPFWHFTNSFLVTREQLLEPTNVESVELRVHRAG